MSAKTFRGHLDSLIARQLCVCTTKGDVRGKLLAVGDDYVTIENPKGQHLIPLHHVTCVRPD